MDFQPGEQPPREPQVPEEEKRAPLVSRRKLLASLGLTGAVVASAGLLASPRLPFANASFLGVTGQVYDPSCQQLIGDMQLFRPEDEDLIHKMKNESVERAVNLKWFGAKGDGVTDDTAAWNAAMEAVPPGGSLYVPPSEEAYYSASGFVCNRDDITIFGSGSGSRLKAGAQKNTLLLGAPSRTVKRKNITVHSLSFSQTPGPAGGGTANNYAGVKAWYVDNAIVANNDFIQCDVGISFASGHASLGFPERVTSRNTAYGNRIVNTNKMGIECFFQDHAAICFNRIYNEESYGPAASHGIRLIGSHHSFCVGNTVERFYSGVSNQGGESGGFRSSRHFFIAMNKLSLCLNGVQGFNDVGEGTIAMNEMECVVGINFKSGTAGAWTNMLVYGNKLYPGSAVGAADGPLAGAVFAGGDRVIYRNNQSIGFGNGKTSGSAYHVYLSALTKPSVVENNYFEDAYYVSNASRNYGVRVFNNETTVFSRHNLFVSPHPDAAQQNHQVGASGTLIKGYGAITDMNDYVAG